jgi:hypothetical protein
MLRSFRITQLQKLQKKLFKMRVGEGGRRILLGDNTGGGADTMRPIRFHCSGIWILTGATCIIN